MRLARRWSDNDHYFGPFTYARDRRYRPLAAIIGSADDEDYGANLRLSAFGHTIIAAIPNWLIRPYREKVVAKGWDEATIARLGRDWYWNVDKREFGFTYAKGHLWFKLGRQTHDSSTTKGRSFFLPWTQWRFVRHSYYGLSGEHVATLPDAGKSYRLDEGRWDKERAIKEAVPRLSYPFADFDGEELAATMLIEEREWKFGEGWFKWLSVFRANKVSRSLDITFSDETGRRKGSWKGGTIGHSIEMLPGELHEHAFRRYCAQNEMKFLG